MISRAEAWEIASQILIAARDEAVRLIKILQKQRIADQRWIEALEPQVAEYKESEAALIALLNLTINELKLSKDSFEVHLLVCTEVSTPFHHIWGLPRSFLMFRYVSLYSIMLIQIVNIYIC